MKFGFFHTMPWTLHKKALPWPADTGEFDATAAEKLYRSYLDCIASGRRVRIRLAVLQRASLQPIRTDGQLQSNGRCSRSSHHILSTSDGGESRADVKPHPGRRRVCDARRNERRASRGR